MIDVSFPETIGVPQITMMIAAVAMGFGAASLLSSDPVALPAVGTVSGVVVGLAGLVVGGGLYVAARRSGSGCGCGGHCDC